jgi:catechol 2,3-dioxygenase-like lactoylglutathione lyase family enzyme
MHKSRLAGFIIDCKTDDLEAAAEFWSAALGCPTKGSSAQAAGVYVGLETPPGDPYFEVQKVSHDSRIHLDIEANDIPAEVARLERLGAKRIAAIRDWIVMEAPTGQRFCVVPVVRDGFEEKANNWQE